MKFSIHKVLLLTVLASALTACHDIEEFDSDHRSTFEQLWTILDEHYCFFEQKGVDWNEVHSRYSPMVADGMTEQELFGVCEQMLAELRDGHTNLSSTFATSYYRKWWSDYPQNYSARLVQEYYFNFNYRTVGGIDYGMLPQNVGYMHYSSFSYGIGEGNLDSILAYMATADGLIIDVRNNGGGNLTNATRMAQRFTNEKVLTGYIQHKTGKGHSDFSDPTPIYVEPSNSIRWQKKVIVLTNRHSYSATNDFVNSMRCFPNVTLVGDKTGGGPAILFGTAQRMGGTLFCQPAPRCPKTAYRVRHRPGQESGYEQRR